MDLEIFRDYCISLPGTTEHLPFDNDTLVFKVGGKLFALCSLQSFVSINLKCDPELAIELREQYADVIPGYHMNKKHWNTIKVNSSVSDRMILDWTKKSYDLVRSALPKKVQEELQ
jgi:predicted DNA-binding protein (MmcQ/YjbR family)